MKHYVHSIPIALTVAASLAIAGAGIASGAVHASAEPNPHMTVTPNPVTSTAPSELTVQGSLYATSNKGSTFGGAYILFGTVTPKDPNDPTSWAPSKRGIPGENYSYAAGLEYQTMVNYPGNTTGDGLPVMDSDGNWSTNLRIPGPEFETNTGKKVNCLEVTCGIITIGAHGRVNAGVEAFEPVSFAQPEPTPTEKPEPTPTEKPEPTPTEKPEPTPTEKPEPTPTEKPEPTPTEKPEPTSVVTVTAVPVPSGGPGTPGPVQPPALPVTGGQGIGLAGLTVAAIAGGAVLMRRRQTH